ncbi:MULTISPECIES: hypothetical protein [Pseudomonas]|uniref:hypothetical protein n=1 Tax=Pseudomonas TaxID=286 RepID=UPI0012323887|nr:MULTISPECIES: hypothetical protein [Pseudomonas]KAA6195492.1 hypothetical protein F3K52_09765 [Pseudomonas lactis]MBJ2204681.1 hypothetical protein [Pseudomonas carnis]MQT99513.1 hypothetical protein [Pseudomonas sp. FSL R10-2245]
MVQNFQGGVGQAAEGDINNYGINISLADADKAETRGLVTAQRKELHELRAKCEELGDDPRDVWRTVHAHLGVTSINEITADQFSEAREVMRQRLEYLREGADKRRLVGKVLRAVAEKDAKAEMNTFCDLSFGRTQLKDLEKAQLQKTLEYVLQFKAVVASASEPAELTFQSFVLLYKKNAAGIFALGILIGAVLF